MFHLKITDYKSYIQYYPFVLSMYQRNLFPYFTSTYFIRAGAFLPKLSNPLVDTQLRNFLEKYPNTIYVSEGAITNAIEIKDIIDIFKHYPQYGFIFVIREDTNLLEQLR